MVEGWHSLMGCLKTFKIHTNFVMGTLIKLFCYQKKFVYPYEYMNNWKRFDERSLTDKKAFYNKLDLDDITDVDYRHEKREFKENRV